jgi:hypothetical protein
MEIEMEAKEIDYSSLEVDGINYSDYPDFCDAYICGGFFKDGTPLDDETVIELNENGDLIYELVYKRIY